MELAPIVLFVYNRYDHTSKTVEALSNNYLACESDLYIFSDAPASEDHSLIDKVEEVRKYLKSIKGFKNVTIIERPVNYGLANSVRDGVSEIVKKYGSVIVIEDDLVSSPYFLKFMNDALKYYQSEEKIFTVSGYSNLKLPKTYINDVYFAHVSNSWGWATWEDRWSSIVWDRKLFLDFLDDGKKLGQALKRVGNHRVNMLRSQLDGRIDSWAVLRLFNQVAQNKMTVFPRETLIKNIGHDGTGVHCKLNRNFDRYNEISMKKNFVNIPFEENKTINHLVYKKNNITFYDKVLNKISALINVRKS